MSVSRAGNCDGEASTLARAKRTALRQLAPPSADGWFAAHGLVRFAFLREVWIALPAGRSGLLAATTGAGKTYAVCFGILNRAIRGEVSGAGLRLRRITPMGAADPEGHRLTHPLAAIQRARLQASSSLF
jgi:hypothetical protein